MKCVLLICTNSFSLLIDVLGFPIHQHRAQPIISPPVCLCADTVPWRGEWEGVVSVFPRGCGNGSTKLATSAFSCPRVYTLRAPDLGVWWGVSFPPGEARSLPHRWGWGAGAPRGRHLGLPSVALWLKSAEARQAGCCGSRPFGDEDEGHPPPGPCPQLVAGLDKNTGHVEWEQEKALTDNSYDHMISCRHGNSNEYIFLILI